VKFIVQYRTKISQILGAVYILCFLFSQKKLEIEYPIATEIMFLTGCVLVSLGVVGRLWCALYIAGRKTSSLITLGPYSVCRNPLYLFSLLGATGVGLCADSITLAAVIPFVFAIIYPITIKNEERRLLNVHGQSYADYMIAVPRFIPKWSLYREPVECKVNTKIFRREMRDAAYFIWIVVFFQVLEALIDRGVVKTLFSLY
jgi:protein-S-isoprenylcysteine O-methyltransferase Ste14